MLITLLGYFCDYIVTKPQLQHSLFAEYAGFQ